MLFFDIINKDGKIWNSFEVMFFIFWQKQLHSSIYHAWLYNNTSIHNDNNLIEQNLIWIVLIVQRNGYRSVEEG